ncbi:MAG: ERF family protein, partial [Candidatus Nanoarchaeia archaeon]|nr:ERF family protein [Candidatus Nanoarchaeia archaeon]
MNLYQKLIEVRKIVPYLQKENQGEQYKYVSSSQVLGNVKAKLDELGILLIPTVKSHAVSISSIEILNEKGTPTKRTNTYFTELDMLMVWVNAEKPDEKIECTWYGQGVDIAGEKGVGKALTYAEKYFMLKFFNIPTDKDDPDAFQKRIDDEDPKPPPSKPAGAQSKSKSSDKDEPGASEKASKGQVAEVFKGGGERKKAFPEFDIFKLLNDLAETGSISNKYPYADQEKTKINWT